MTVGLLYKAGALDGDRLAVRLSLEVGVGEPVREAVPDGVAVPVVVALGVGLGVPVGELVPGDKTLLGRGMGSRWKSLWRWGYHSTTKVHSGDRNAVGYF